MANFVRICSQAEIPAVGQVKEFVVEGRALCVANVDGTVCVLDGTCPHEGGPLGEGSIEGGKLVCPWHGWVWDPKTGRTDDDPNSKIPVYQIKIEGDDVLVEI